MPGHVGIKDNEGADRLVGTATVENGQAMDRADIVNALREAGCNKDSSGNCDS